MLSSMRRKRKSKRNGSTPCLPLVFEQKRPDAAEGWPIDQVTGSVSMRLRVLFQKYVVLNNKM